MNSGNQMVDQIDYPVKGRGEANPFAGMCDVCGWPVDVRGGCMRCADRQRDKIVNLLPKAETPCLDKLIMWAKDYEADESA